MHKIGASDNYSVVQSVDTERSMASYSADDLGRVLFEKTTGVGSTKASESGVALKYRHGGKWYCRLDDAQVGVSIAAKLGWPSAA